MSLILVFFLFRSLSFAGGILGGFEIDIEEAPYQINYGDICGGVLIHQQWVITVAHCGTEYFIRIGNKQRQAGTKVKIRNHIVHPRFGKKHGFDYDIQLLQLFKNLRINDKVTPIEINDGIFGDYIYVAGWGHTKEKGKYSDVLKQVKLKMISFKMCQNVEQKWYNNTLTTRMFCAGGDEVHDACQGDSGSGAVSIGRLVGIASFGFGCGRNFPGVYINVTETRIRDWIKNHTGV